MRYTARSAIRRPGAMIRRSFIGVRIFIALTVITLPGIFLLGHAAKTHHTPAELRAAALMGDACSLVRSERYAGGWRPDVSVDPNRTGMIGEEYGPYTTSIGEIQAKRTSTDPSMAMLMVRLFEEVGAQEGDAVAVGASGSFPALLVATLAAARSLGLRPLVAASVGASQWGANAEDYNMIDLLGWLKSSHVSGFDVIGLTLGGEGDRGSGFDPELRDDLAQKIKDAGFPFWTSPTIRGSVRERAERFDAALGARRLACYVNIGGNVANMGVGLDVLALRPGITSPDWRNVPRKDWGVLHEMAARGIPTIHLLYMKGLVTRYALPWDPSPLTDPEGLETQTQDHGDILPYAAIAYLILFLAVLAIGRISKKKGRIVPSDSVAPPTH